MSRRDLRPGDVVFEGYFHRFHIVTHLMSGCIAQTVSIEIDGLKTRALLTPRPPGDKIIYGED